MASAGHPHQPTTRTTLPEPCPSAEWKAPRRLERNGWARDVSAQPLTTSATLSRANYPHQPTTRDLNQRKPRPGRGTGNHPVSRTRSPCSAADHRRKWRDSISDMPCAEYVVTSRTDVGRACAFHPRKDGGSAAQGSGLEIRRSWPPGSSALATAVRATRVLGHGQVSGRNIVITVRILAPSSLVRSKTRANAKAPNYGRPGQAGADGGTLKRHPGLPGNAEPCALADRLRRSASTKRECGW